MKGILASRIPRWQQSWGFAALLLVMMPGTASAEPWLEVGDRTIRGDIETLATYGLIDTPLSTWPVPAGDIERLSNETLLVNAPDHVQLAAHRVLRRLIGDGQPEGLHPEADLRIASQPDVVRDFGALARDEFDARAGLVWDGNKFSAALRAGEQSHFNGSQGRPSLDGSYLSFLLANWQLYGGWVDQWYGPGWASSLILSNNARPFPKLGIMRNNSRAAENSWFSWLGPWQLNFFVGMLDGPRIDRNTAFGSLRFAFSPTKHLEVGFSRITEFCGEHHSCSPLKAAFQFNNNSNSVNSANDEAAFDLKYTRRFGYLSVSPYLQLMNEDTGPFTHSDTSYLGGTSLSGPLGESGAQWRMTIEYADTVPTVNIFGFGKVAHGVAYNNYQYGDGMRYRDRTLGFSLDSDSRLLSIADAITDSRGWTYRVVYYHASISTSTLSNMQQQSGSALITTRNSVSAVPVTLNQGELGLSIPWHVFTLDLAVRAQDAAVPPAQNDRFAGEVNVGYRF